MASALLAYRQHVCKAMQACGLHSMREHTLSFSPTKITSNPNIKRKFASLLQKKEDNIPFLTPMARTSLSRMRKEKSRFHTHPETSVAIMAVCLSLNISHFYNTERGNTDNLDCFPWSTRHRQLPPIREPICSVQETFFRFFNFLSECLCYARIPLIL